MCLCEACLHAHGMLLPALVCAASLHPIVTCGIASDAIIAASQPSSEASMVRAGEADNHRSTPDPAHGLQLHTRTHSRHGHCLALDCISKSSSWKLGVHQKTGLDVKLVQGKTGTMGFDELTARPHLHKALWHVRQESINACMVPHGGLPTAGFQSPMQGTAHDMTSGVPQDSLGHAQADACRGCMIAR